MSCKRNIFGRNAQIIISENFYIEIQQLNLHSNVTYKAFENEDNFLCFIVFQKYSPVYKCVKHIITL